MSGEGFLEELKKQKDGPEFDPERPIGDLSLGEASGNLAWQQLQEENAKANIPFSEDPAVDVLNQQYYEDSIIMFAMETANGIKGLEFESYADWEAHVDMIVAKIKANRS